VRAAIRAHIWPLIAASTAGFPWLRIAGKLLADWLVAAQPGNVIGGE